MLANNLREFRPIVHALKTGNLGLMEDAMAKHEFFFVRTGIYLLVEKLKLIVIRQLFRSVQKMLGSHQLQLQAFLDALHYSGMPDCDMEELECLMAGLIRYSLVTLSKIKEKIKPQSHSRLHLPSTQKSGVFAQRAFSKSGKMSLTAHLTVHTLPTTVG